MGKELQKEEDSLAMTDTLVRADFIGTGGQVTALPLREEIYYAFSSLLGGGGLPREEGHSPRASHLP